MGGYKRRNVFSVINQLRFLFVYFVKIICGIGVKWMGGGVLGRLGDRRKIRPIMGYFVIIGLRPENALNPTPLPISPYPFILPGGNPARRRKNLLKYG